MDRRLALGWTLAIAIGCSLPGNALPVSVWLSFDKVLHLLAFAGFGWLWLRAYPHAARAVLLSGLLFAVGTEVYQHLMPIGRFFDPIDALADALGLLIGLGAARWHQRDTRPNARFSPPEA
ncbi:MAG: VanZ family protein [Rhodothermaceae bacterium]|nr:VanZ family protein [Rhodothermaceae bacterium]